MLHAPPPPGTANAKRSIFTRQRFAAAGAFLLVPFVPFELRIQLLPYFPGDASVTGSLVANMVAVVIAFWLRLSVQTFPGTRSGAVIFPSISAAHGIVLTMLLLSRIPYDRTALIVGYVVHLAWAYGLYLTVQRNIRQHIAIVPVGEVAQLEEIDSVDWHRIDSPQLDRVVGCDAVVADFANLPPEWERFLADAAIEGRVVYQVKQLYESLTGRVHIEHMSENSFGSLHPVRGYAHLKSLFDLGLALILLPILALPMLLVALAIRLDSKGPALFRQRRVGRGGRMITIYKFRTMAAFDPSDDHRAAAITSEDDDRVTRLGNLLRRSRIDEFPQLLNILKGEMSWIGPRPEAAVLSSWYTGEIPFYRYRHVVKPGISGWAQVNQGHVANVDEVHEKLQYDFFYIKYFSPWLDVLILFRTIKTMLSGFGAR